jgi:hypothetical protein
MPLVSQQVHLLVNCCICSVNGGCGGGGGDGGGQIESSIGC